MAETVEENPGTIDETPISPVSSNSARRNSLTHHLANRPNRSELVEKNILPDSHAAPGLLASQKELQKHMLEDKVNERISHRPSPEDLIKSGMLHEDPRSPEEMYEEAIEEEYAKREGGA